MATRIQLRVDEVGDELVIRIEAPGLYAHQQPHVRATIEDGMLEVRAPLQRPHVEGFHPDASGV